MRLKKVFIAPSSRRAGLDRATGVGTQFPDLVDKIADDFGKLRRFGRRDPFYGVPLRVDPQIVQNQAGGLSTGLSFVITFQVMTVAQVSPHDQDAVNALG
jgi:hypothetical protein